jgi:hypothetical protein
LKNSEKFTGQAPVQEALWINRTSPKLPTPGEHKGRSSPARKATISLYWSHRLKRPPAKTGGVRKPADPLAPGARRRHEHRRRKAWKYRVCSGFPVPGFPNTAEMAAPAAKPGNVVSAPSPILGWKQLACRGLGMSVILQHEHSGCQRGSGKA